MTPHIPAPAIIQQVQDDRLRGVLMKIELLKVHPFCKGCGKPVVAMAGRVNSASLIIDRLACPDCVDKVRKDRIRERSDNGNTERWVERNTARAQRKEELIAIDPHCTCCRDRLGEKEISVVAGHLFCTGCVGKVRQRKKAVQLEIIAEMKAKWRADGLVTQ